MYLLDCANGATHSAPKQQYHLYKDRIIMEVIGPELHLNHMNRENGLSLGNQGKIYYAL
jgi:hypothetical protein